MKNKILKSIKALLIGVLLVSTSCTDLDETLYSELAADNFYQNRTEVMQSAMRPFTHMQAWIAWTGSSNYHYLNELSADQQAWPQKGKHGYDGGDHFRMHYHTWTNDESRINNCWELMWTGVAYCNSGIINISKIDPNQIDMTEDELNTVVAELKVLRAFHYLKLMDLFGNVPIVTQIGDDDLNPETKSSSEVFDFIESELLDNVGLLNDYSIDNIGTTTKTAAYAMLSELYLNAEVWKGEAMYEECIAACDSILDGKAGGLAGGQPSLEDNIFDAFSNTNSTTSEGLFQIAYSRSGGFEYDWGAFYVGYDNIKQVFYNTIGGWNAFVTVPSAYDAYADNDLRKNGSDNTYYNYLNEGWFLMGPQYVYGSSTETVLGTEEYANQPLEYVNYIHRASEGSTEEGMSKGEENSGARFNKYKSGTLEDENYKETDFLIYRLTEIYFNKAEALMRLNSNQATQDAVDLINDCRVRAFTATDWATEQYTTSTLTMDELLAERGREFIFEGKRRTDLIRFDKFVTTSWWDHKPKNDEHLRIFPIPQRQIANNPGLVQNPGY